MINQPSDLFQINTSYLHGNKTVTLILQVPMVSEENKLNLLQFTPFPLSQSLGANTTITPKVDKDLIAVGKHHQYKILGQTNLAACTKLGQNFFCEGRSVLCTDIEDSCLGALYLHNLPGTLKHCHFELGETREHVFQTGPSQWLVSAPETFSSELQCEKSHGRVTTLSTPRTSKTSKNSRHPKSMNGSNQTTWQSSPSPCLYFSPFTSPLGFTNSVLGNCFNPWTKPSRT
jgi:hypothetical protein